MTSRIVGLTISRCASARFSDSWTSCSNPFMRPSVAPAATVHECRTVLTYGRTRASRLRRSSPALWDQRVEVVPLDSTGQEPIRTGKHRMLRLDPFADVGELLLGRGRGVLASPARRRARRDPARASAAAHLVALPRGLNARAQQATITQPFDLRRSLSAWPSRTCACRESRPRL